MHLVHRYRLHPHPPRWRQVKPPTQGDYKRLASLAVQVAMVPPLKRNPQTQNAVVPWTVVDGIRRELDDLGIDWRGAKASAEADRGWVGT